MEIKTRFMVNQHVWFMHANCACEMRIAGLQVSQSTPWGDTTLGKIKVEYKFEDSAPGNSNIWLTRTEDKVFATKAELLGSL